MIISYSDCKYTAIKQVVIRFNNINITRVKLGIVKPLFRLRLKFGTDVYFMKHMFMISWS